VLVDDLPIAAVEISLHGLALGIQAKATFAPSPGEDPVEQTNLPLFWTMTASLQTGGHAVSR
jgi:hypothetical protein